MGKFSLALLPFPVVDGTHMYYGIALQQDEYHGDGARQWRYDKLGPLVQQVYGFEQKGYSHIAAEATFEYKV